MAREAGPETQAIRALVDANKDITFKNGGEAALLKQGIKGVNENGFNVTKHLWLKRQGGAAPAKAAAPKVRTATVARRPAEPVRRGRKPAAVPVTDTVGFIQSRGGLAAVKAEIAELQSAVTAFEGMMAAMQAAS